jgi:hypothetical protein
MRAERYALGFSVREKWPEYCIRHHTFTFDLCAVDSGIKSIKFGHLGVSLV